MTRLEKQKRARFERLIFRAVSRPASRNWRETLVRLVLLHTYVKQELERRKADN